jgi:hypothetical protein
MLDGEIVVLDAEGRPRFYDLLRRRGQPVFYAFDCLALDGRDLRGLPPLERKRMLAKIVKRQPGILYAQHFRHGTALFQLVCEQDLEGVVAKRKNAAYGEGWFKIRNPKYSQYEGRRELLERRRIPEVIIGWILLPRREMASLPTLLMLRSAIAQASEPGWGGALCRSRNYRSLAQSRSYRLWRSRKPAPYVFPFV